MYNAQKYISRCIKSLMIQTYDNIQIIVVNDGSTDNSLEIVTSLASKDKRIKVYNQNNKGASEARVTGLKHLDNDTSYFAFCDADDYVNKNYIMSMLEMIKKYSADIVACPSIKFLGPFRRNAALTECFKKINVYNHDEIMESLYISYFGITNFPGYLHSKLYDIKWARHMLDMPPIVKFMADDLTINIRILPLCDKIVTIPNPLYYYRFGGGTSKFMPDFMNDYMNYHKLQLELAKCYNCSEKYLYFSCIEIINVLHTWIVMCSMNKEFSTEELYCEVIKWRENEDIIFALNNIKPWGDAFKIMLENYKFDDLINIIKLESKRKEKKVVLMNIVKQISEIF